MDTGRRRRGGGGGGGGERKKVRFISEDPMCESESINTIRAQ